MEQRLIDANAFIQEKRNMYCKDCNRRKGTKKNGKKGFVYQIGDVPCRACEVADMLDYIEEAPTVDAVPVPGGGIGEISDGYHTFNGLYYQRLILFAVIVKTYKDKAWKSRRHEDGKLCFGGGWFVVGIDTPQGSYTYHYEDKYFDLFDCEELPNGKEWDGHTEVDVTRLLTLCAGKERNDIALDSKFHHPLFKEDCDRILEKDREAEEAERRIMELNHKLSERSET